MRIHALDAGLIAFVPSAWDNAVVGDWLILVVLWSFTAGVVVVGLFGLTDRRVNQWSVRFGVLVEDSIRPQVRQRLWRARAIRWIAFAIGLNVGMLPMHWNVIDAERAGDFANDLTSIAPVGAAVLGSLVAEIALVQRPRGSLVAATTTRRWSDYIDRFWLVFIAGCVPVAVIATWVGPAGPGGGGRWMWVAPVMCVVALAAVTIGIRVVVDRPAGADSDRMLRIDDALRADGIHHIVGGAVALAGLSATQAVNRAIPPSLLTVVLALLNLVFLAVWITIATSSRWNVDVARLQHR